MLIFKNEIRMPPFCCDRERWWVLWLTTVSTCGTWGRRDPPSSTPSSSTERGKKWTQDRRWWEIPSVAIEVSVSPSLSDPPPQSGPLTLALARHELCPFRTWAVTHFTACVNCFCSFVTLYANRRHFVWQNVSTRLQNCAQGKERWQRCSPSPPPSLSLSVSLSLSLFLTERSLFGSLPLPLRLFPLPGHRCEPTQTPEGFHTSGLQTHTGKTEHKHKQTQAITTPTVEHTCYTDAPASGWRMACEMKNFSGWVNKHDEKCCVVGLKS